MTQTSLRDFPTFKNEHKSTEKTIPGRYDNTKRTILCIFFFLILSWTCRMPNMYVYAWSQNKRSIIPCTKLDSRYKNNQNEFYSNFFLFYRLEIKIRWYTTRSNCMLNLIIIFLLFWLWFFQRIQHNRQDIIGGKYLIMMNWMKPIKAQHYGMKFIDHGGQLKTVQMIHPNLY